VTCTHFVDPNEGWVCYNAQIHHTTDGGYSWETQTNPTGEWLKSISFVSPESGCIVGYYSSILRTNDGGETWIVQDAPTDYNPLYDVFFTDSLTGWIAYSRSSLLFTETAGTLWEVQPIGISAVGSFNRLWFSDDQTGWISANTGEVAHTTDGGETWVLLKSADGGVNDMDFADAEHGAQVYYNTEAIVFTVDGGNSWEIESLPTDESGWETLGSNLTVGDQRGISWVPPNDIWVCGSYNGVMYSSDSGLTWELQSIPTEIQTLFDICFLDSNTGYACGATGIFDGAVIKTENGGETWQSIGPVPCPRFSSLDFISPDSGVVVPQPDAILINFVFVLMVTSVMLLGLVELY